MGQEHDDWLAGFGFDVSKYSRAVSDVVQFNSDIASSQGAAFVSTTTGAAAAVASAVGADTAAKDLHDVQSTANAESNVYEQLAEMAAGSAAAELGVTLPGQENNPINIVRRADEQAQELGASLPPPPPPDLEATREESEDE